jgi:tRNA-uridine 2-sulfurtransferase
MKKKRVIVAMSGGVDSAVAAARLVDDGWDVVGVTLHLWDYPESGAGSHQRCCAPEDQYDAKRTADALRFPHFTFDRRAMFETEVVNPFVDAYAAGSTPSPCTACNRTVKLRELLGIANRLGADAIATGHYARVHRDERGVFIAEGVDKDKDQSYFLYASPKELIERLVFPLGESCKPEVRAEAIRRDLPGATKGESQELCFVGEGAKAYADFVEKRGARIRPGRILDVHGNVRGEHAGIHRFTIGQRKGLGIALGEPAFVTRIDAVTADVVLGPSSGLLANGARLRDLTLASGIQLPLKAKIRVRYRHSGALGSVSLLDDKVVVSFEEPVRALTKGQVAVFYDCDSDRSDVVLGGAIFEEVNTVQDEVSDTPSRAAGLSPQKAESI